MKLFYLIALISFAVCSPATGAPSSSEQIQESAFRPKLSVRFLYDQWLDGVYTTAWYGRLERSEGEWRDVYVETGGKGSFAGMISFNCDDRLQKPVGIFDHQGPTLEYEAKPLRRLSIAFQSRQKWMSGMLNSDIPFLPPYEAFVVAQSQYC